MLTRRVLLSVIALASLSPGTGAAQGKCDPVPDDVVILASPLYVYTACEVDRRATGPRPTKGPQFEVRSTFTGTCWRATIDVVIDTNDVPLPATARVVKTNDSVFAAALVKELPQLAFKAAIKGGQPVRQLLRFDYNRSRPPQGPFVVRRMDATGPPIRSELSTANC